MPETLLKQLSPKELSPKEEEVKKEVKEEVKPKKDKIKEFAFNEGKTKAEFIERLIDILDDFRADDRTEWTEISFIINNELGKEGLSLFQSFSKRSDKYEGEIDDKLFKSLVKSEKVWNSYQES